MSCSSSYDVIVYDAGGQKSKGSMLIGFKLSPSLPRPPMASMSASACVCECACVCVCVVMCVGFIWIRCACLGLVSYFKYELPVCISTWTEKILVFCFCFYFSFFCFLLGFFYLVLFLFTFRLFWQRLFPVNYNQGIPIKWATQLKIHTHTRTHTRKGDWIQLESVCSWGSLISALTWQIASASWGIMLNLNSLKAHYLPPSRVALSWYHTWPLLMFLVNYLSPSQHNKLFLSIFLWIFLYFDI